METKDERRKRRLMWLVQHTEGGLKAVAEQSGLSDQALDQVIKGSLLPVKKSTGTREKKSLGDTSVEKLELGCGLHRGWFDWPFDRVDGERYWALDEATKAVVQQKFLDAIKEQEDLLQSLTRNGTNG